jgi:hypothetical protein
VLSLNAQLPLHNPPLHIAKNCWIPTEWSLVKYRGPSPNWHSASHRWPVMTRLETQLAEPTAKRKARESWGEAWRRGDPACEPAPSQPDPLRSQSKHAPAAPSPSTYARVGACQPSSRHVTWRRRLPRAQSTQAINSLFSNIVCSLLNVADLHVTMSSRSRGVDGMLDMARVHTLCLDCPDWGNPPLHWHSTHAVGSPRAAYDGRCTCT